MADNAALIQKREELKEQLAAGRYQALAAVILDRIDRLTQRLTGRSTPLPFWYGGLVFSLIILIMALLVSISLDESPTPEMLTIALWAAALGFLVMTLTRLSTGMFLSMLQKSVIDAIVSMTSLEHLQDWLITTFDRKKQFITALLLALALGLATPFFWSAIRNEFAGFGPVVGATLILFQVGLGWYFVLPVLAWLTELDAYQFKLYAANPGSSEVIDRLGGLLNNLIFAWALLVALFTLGLIYFELLNPTISVLALLLGTWGPLFILFASTQFALARIITDAKWSTLNQIQKEIEQLRLAENMADKATMEAVNRLMDYHDRVRATRNSALDLRAGLNFLNSLLLPLLAFVLANIDRVVAFFSGP